MLLRPERALGPGPGSTLLFVLLVIAFLVTLVIMAILLQMSQSQLRRTGEAFIAEREKRMRLKAAYKRRGQRRARPRTVVRRKKAVLRKAKPNITPRPPQFSPPVIVPEPTPLPSTTPPTPDVEVVETYSQETEASAPYEAPEVGDRDLDARLGMALGSSVYDEIEDEREKKKEEAKRAERREKIRILDVFLLYRDGRMLYHISKKQRLVDQSQEIGAMLTALQMFVKQSLDRDRGGAMDELVSGKLCIVMEYGELVNLAVVLEGRGDRKLRGAMRLTLEEIHRDHYSELLAWDGKLSRLGDEESIIKKRILGEYEEEEFHMGGAAILDLSGAGTFRVGNEDE